MNATATAPISIINAHLAKFLNLNGKTIYLPTKKNISVPFQVNARKEFRNPHSPSNNNINFRCELEYNYSNIHELADIYGESENVEAALKEMGAFHEQAGGDYFMWIIDLASPELFARWGWVAERHLGDVEEI